MEIYHPRDEELLREMRRVRRSAKRRRLIWGLVIWFLLSVAAGFFLFNRFYLLAVMQGPAMGDTLPVGSLVLVRRAETGKNYTAGDILLYEKTLAEPLEIIARGTNGKVREYCKYIVYRDLGSTRQYLAREEGQVRWISEQFDAENYESDQEGKLLVDTEGMPNGEYWLREVSASYGQKVLEDPIPFNVNNPVLTQVKRVLAASGDRIVLSPYTAIKINSKDLNRTFTSGRGEDVDVETRRINVRDGEYFVQGDQLSLSVDSRYRDYGTVKQENVAGKACLILWPLARFGTPETSLAEGGAGE